MAACHMRGAALCDAPGKEGSLCRKPLPYAASFFSAVASASVLVPRTNTAAQETTVAIMPPMVRPMKPMSMPLGPM